MTTNGALFRLTQGLDKTITLTPDTRHSTIYAVWYYEFRIKYHLSGEFASWGEGVDSYWYSPINNVTTNISNAKPTWIDPSSNVEYTFLGWSYTPNSDTVDIPQGGQIEMVADSSGYQEVNLYAVWDRSPLSTTEVEEKPQAKTETKPIEQVIPKVEKVQEPIESVEPKVVEQPIEEQMVVEQEPMVQEPPKVEEGELDEQVS